MNHLGSCYSADSDSSKSRARPGNCMPNMLPCDAQAVDTWYTALNSEALGDIGRGQKNYVLVLALVALQAS